VAAQIAQPVQWLTTRWMVRGSNTGGGEIFPTLPDRSWGPFSLLSSSFPKVNRPRCDANHPTSSSAKVKERVVLPISLLPFWAFVACTRIEFVFVSLLFYHTIRFIRDAFCIRINVRIPDCTLNLGKGEGGSFLLVAITFQIFIFGCFIRFRYSLHCLVRILKT